MTLFTFAFEETKTNGNSNFQTWKNYSNFAKNNQVHTIESHLNVKRKPIGPGTDYDWERRYFRFNTSNGIQSLVADLHTTEMVGNNPRYYIYGFETQKDDLVEGLYERDMASPGNWKPLDTSRPFPLHLSTVKIQFKMPFPTDPFKFRLIVWDLDRDWDVPCDPQVGNGPPKP